MNKTLKFGYDFLGAYALVKLNVKLTDTQVAYLDYLYHKELKFISNRDGLTRIEGVLNADTLHRFIKYLKCAILRSKIEMMTEELNAITSQRNVTMIDIDWTKADLDKI